MPPIIIFQIHPKPLDFPEIPCIMYIDKPTTKEHEMKIRLGASVRVMAGGRQETGQIIACEGNCEAGYTYTIRLRNGSIIQRDRQEIDISSE